jgi:hypothetical protein
MWREGATGAGEKPPTSMTEHVEWRGEIEERDMEV